MSFLRKGLVALNAHKVLSALKKASDVRIQLSLCRKPYRTGRRGTSPAFAWANASRDRCLAWGSPRPIPRPPPTPPTTPHRWLNQVVGSLAQRFHKSSRRGREIGAAPSFHQGHNQIRCAALEEAALPGGRPREQDRALSVVREIFLFVLGLVARGVGVARAEAAVRVI